MRRFAMEWWSAAQGHLQHVIAKELYCGRGFKEAQSTAEKFEAPCYVVSAGLGLIEPDDRVPPYDFTLADLAEYRSQSGSGCWQLGLWWHEINQVRGRPKPLRRLLHDHSAATVVVALSGRYLGLVHEELATLPGWCVQRLRVISGSRLIPAELINVTMPYDGRFDGPDSPLPGTRTDFAPRAARHFVEEIWSRDPDAPASVHASSVAAVLEEMRPPDAIRRNRVRDEDVRRLIQKFWHDAGGASSQMLRLLRDREGVACEQGRFARLFREVKKARSW